MGDEKRPDETIAGGVYVNADGDYVNANGEYVDAGGKPSEKPVAAKKVLAEPPAPSVPKPK